MKPLTRRDREILDALIFKIGAFTAWQIVRHWWPQSGAGRKNGMRRLRMLTERGLIQWKPLHVKAITGVELVGRGGPGLAPADPSMLSRECKRRWELPVKRAAVVTATERARRILGGPSLKSVQSLHHLNHAIAVSEVYLNILRNRPELAEHWVGEDEFEAPAFREAQPDALILDDAGEPQLALEFGSDYGTDRYRRLMETLQAKALHYEIFGAA